VNESSSHQDSAVRTLTKQISDADVALFLLVTGQVTVTPEQTPIPSQTTRQIAPMGLLAAMLSGAAAQHGLRPGAVRFFSEQVRFIEPAYTEDTLTATAELVARDSATQSVRIVAHCENQDGRRLAEGEFLLSDQ
jgi:acyl-coenzyme A thioesterase PaaI-like protein